MHEEKDEHELRLDIERYRVLEEETTDPLAAILLHDIVSEMESALAEKRQVLCQCGAIYERAEEQIAFRLRRSFNCKCCGVVLEAWDSSRVPTYHLISK